MPAGVLRDTLWHQGLGEHEVHFAGVKSALARATSRTQCLVIGVEKGEELWELSSAGQCPTLGIEPHSWYAADTAGRAQMWNKRAEIAAAKSFVRVVHMALSSPEDVASGAVRTSGDFARGSSSGLAHPLTVNESASRPPLSTLDTYLSTSGSSGGCTNVSLLSCDTDGYELAILRGAVRTLPTVEVLLVELSAKAHPADDLVRILELLGVNHELFDFPWWGVRKTKYPLVQLTDDERCDVRAA